MKSNPYQKFKRPQVASELRFGGTGSRVIASNGEINASDKKDLMAQVASLLQQAATTGLETENDAVAREELAKVHADMVTAAFQDKQAHAELGATLANELYVAGKRDGFMRRLLARQDVVRGTIPHFRMRMKNVVAISAAAPTQLKSQIVRDNLYFPPEFYISMRPFIEQREIEQSATDVLEEKYIESLEAGMVEEDRIWYRLAAGTVGVANDFTNISGQLTPTTLAAMRTQVTRWNIPAVNCLIAADIWNDIIGEASFSGVMDPVSKHELLLTGQLGTIYGMTIYTDGFRHPQHRVFNQGDITIVGDSVNHGVYTDRGGWDSRPTDATHENVPGRGWVMTMLMSQTIANARSVARGNRS